MKTLAVTLSMISGVLIGAAILLWLAAGEIYDYQDTFDLEHKKLASSEPVDVVLCLAGGKGRIPVAVEVFREIKQRQSKAHAPVLFFSGVGHNASLNTLKEQGVSSEKLEELRHSDVVFEDISENTFENAQLFASFAKKHHWKKVILVTASYHMRRSLFIFKRALGPDAEILTYTADSGPFDRTHWHRDAYAIRVTVSEYIKWLFYRYEFD